MNKLLLFSILLSITSCTETTKNNPTNHTQIKPKIEQNFQPEISYNDSIKQAILDTTNTHNSPVKILSSKIFNDVYSNHKSIQLTYKNISKKDIKGIKVEWYCLNAFEKPASGKHFFEKGKSNGLITDYLKKTKTASKVWEDFSTDATTVLSARAYEVVFTDGTKWNLHPKKDIKHL